MQSPSPKIKPDYILQVIIRRRWFIIIPFCIALIDGICLSLTLPKVYQASTMIMVQAQRVPTSYVQSVVTTDITTRLQTISQQILSRTNIERIISDFRLFSEPEYETMFMEDKVASVRKVISVNVAKSSTFTITFKGTDPEKVKNITNALATYFIDENLKIRESQAVGTSDFLDDELETMLVRLKESEQILREYRQKYMGELPEQLTSNLSILQQLNEDLSEKQKTLMAAKANLTALEKQIVEIQSLPTSNDATDDTAFLDLSQDSSELSTLREKLATLKSRGYTDEHPDVLRVKKMIEKLEAKTDPAPGTGDTSSETATEEQASDSSIPADYRALQKSHLSDARLQVKNLELNISELQKKIAIYQERVENTPKREEELLSIKRDYNNMQAAYDSLLERRLEAEISVNMEKKQKGEQFQVVDPATTPQKPVEPNMQRLFLLTIAAGLGLGGAIIFLFEYLNTSYRNEEEIEDNLGIPILAKIPNIMHAREKTKQRLNNMFSAASVCFSLLLLALFAVIALKGADKTIDFIRSLI